LEKVVSQIETIQQTLQVLDYRISKNEQSVSIAVEEFRSYREQKFDHQQQQPAGLMSFNARTMLNDQVAQN
jgi:hypothetical protein